MTELPSGTVTFLFTDIEGSTRLLQRLGSGYGAVLAEHRGLLRAAVGSHGGVEVDTQGDAFFVAFPQAAAAVAAAEEAQRALDGIGVRVRMGIHTGEPTLTDEGYVGIDVHRGSRICDVCHGGQVLLSASTRALLADRVGVRDLGEHRLKDLSEPQRLYQLGDDEFPPLRSLHRTNLPVAPMPLVGRYEELDRVVSLLRRDDVRLLTLTGPGGTGKTRLAMAAAAELVDEYEHGAFFVELAPLADPGFVVPAIAQTLEVRGELDRYLADRHLLLVIDNFEHVLPAAGEVSELLAAVPALNLLVTSREALRLTGEREYPVPPMREEDAVELFRERAHDTGPLEAVVEICRRLDFLPLAIELAAVRTKHVSTPKLLERIERRLPLLVGGSIDAPLRQQTLRAAIEWSYDLLLPEEQRVFAQFAVFVGGATLEAAEEVCRTGLETLAGLVDKSLLALEAERYRMLETIREYSDERLNESSEGAEVRNRHAEYFAALAAALEPELRGPDQRAALDRLSGEHDNLRGALGWSLGEGGLLELGARTAVGLWWFWWVRGHWREGEMWLKRALEGIPAESAQARASTLEAAGRLAWAQADLDAARALFDEALSIARELGDARLVRDALNGLGNVAYEAGDLAVAQDHFERALELDRELADRRAVAVELHNLGKVALAGGRLPRDLFEESLALMRDLRNPGGIAISLYDLGALAEADGDWARAALHYAEAVEILRQLEDFRLFAKALNGLGRAARALGDLERAGKAHQEALAVASDLADAPSIAEALAGLSPVSVD